MHIIYAYSLHESDLGPSQGRIQLPETQIRFSDAEPALFDPMALTIEDESSEDEQRFVSIGTDVLNRVVVVVYTYRNDGIRLISARRATRRERQAYEEGI